MADVKKQTIYKEVTSRIINELEQGRIPWVQPWGVQAGGLSGPETVGLPQNAVTGNYYSGINILLLWGTVFDQGYSCQNWLTFAQARKLGGSVRKGEHGTTIVYADSFISQEERKRALADGSDPVSIPFLKRYKLFNVEQCEDLPEDCITAPQPLPDCETMPAAESLIRATKADFRIGGAKAFYVPSADFIQVPPQPSFFDQINYYRTCFHELGHWTGHKNRLDRKIENTPGCKLYAREELVAEMTSAFICATLSIKPTVRHADYIASWLDVLKVDDKAIFRAASQASKAANYLLKCGERSENEVTS